MNPLITIGVAVYNVDRKYLSECIESIINSCSEKTEIIIVNDCSTDDCGTLCKKYAAKDRRIRYIEFAKNHGIGYVRNAIIERARGEWIFFVDGDDKIYGNFEDSVVYGSKADCELLIYDYGTFKDERKYSNSLYDVSGTTVTDKETEQFCIACLTEAPCFIGGKSLSKGCTSKGYRKDFLIKNNISFAEDLKISEDSMFYADALYYCKRALYFPFKVYCYREGNDSSITNRYNPETKELINTSLIHACKRITGYFPGREDVKELYYLYKIPAVAYRECKLNIFHKDNPKGCFERRKDFIDFFSEEPYKTAIEKMNPTTYRWRERIIIFNLIKKRRFFMLDFIFRNPIMLCLYSSAAHRMNKLTRRKLPWEKD